jgi:hypothetical protein
LFFFFFFFFKDFNFELAANSAALPPYDDYPKLLTKKLNQHHSLIRHNTTARRYKYSSSHTIHWTNRESITFPVNRCLQVLDLHYSNPAFLQTPCLCNSLPATRELHI